MFKLDDQVIIKHQRNHGILGVKSMANEEYYVTDVTDSNGDYKYEYWIYTYTDGHKEQVEKRTYIPHNSHVN